MDSSRITRRNIIPDSQCCLVHGLYIEYQRPSDFRLQIMALPVSGDALHVHESSPRIVQGQSRAVQKQSKSVSSDTEIA